MKGKTTNLKSASKDTIRAYAGPDLAEDAERWVQFSLVGRCYCVMGRRPVTKPSGRIACRGAAFPQRRRIAPRKVIGRRCAIYRKWCRSLAPFSIDPALEKCLAPE